MVYPAYVPGTTYNFRFIPIYMFSPIKKVQKSYIKKKKKKKRCRNQSQRFRQVQQEPFLFSCPLMKRSLGLRAHKIGLDTSLLNKGGIIMYLIFIGKDFTV